MNPQRYKKIKDIVVAAMECDDDSIQALLDAKCGEDLLLRKEVEELLSADINQTFLAHSPIELDTDDIDLTAPLEGMIGRIKISELLAHGGMGDVYAGTDTLLERPVAIKIINPNQRLSAARRTAFLNEAKVISGLQHPNICQVYDFFEALDRDVLVMELIKGKTLRHLLKKDRTSSALNYIIQICKALVSAHERGIAHQDIKPENIMVDANHQIKVLDFGIASFDRKNIHGVEGVSGTPGYMSPEQAKGEIATTATDIYSFALLIIEIYTGKRTFDPALTTFELIEKAKTGETYLPKNIPNKLSKLLIKMLDKDTNERPSARETLVRLLEVQEIPRKRLSVGLTLLGLFLVGFGVWKYTSDLKVERQLALNAKDQAETARANAEGLVNFMLEDLNSGLQSVGRLDLMESVAEKAHQYYQNEDVNEVSGQSAMALIRVAEVYDYQGKKQDAITALKQSLVILNQISLQSSSHDLNDYRIGKANNSLAQIYKLTGDFELSKTHSKNAWDLGLKLTNQSQPGAGGNETLSSQKRWYILLEAIYLNADVTMRQGYSEEAIAILTEVRPVAVEAASVEPNLKSRLADIEFKLCDSLYDAGLDDQSIEPCLGILALDKELYQANPENYRLYSNFAVDHFTLGRVYTSLKQYDKTIAIISEGIVHMEKLYQRDPNNSSSINDLALMYLIKGRALMKSGQSPRGLEFVIKAEKLLLPLLEDEEEITYLNNMFTVHLLLNRQAQATIIAENLMNKGFKRREFLELCQEYAVQVCQPEQ